MTLHRCLGRKLSGYLWKLIWNQESVAYRITITLDMTRDFINPACLYVCVCTHIHTWRKVYTVWSGSHHFMTTHPRTHTYIQSVNMYTCIYIIYINIRNNEFYKRQDTGLLKYNSEIQHYDNNTLQYSYIHIYIYTDSHLHITQLRIKLPLLIWQLPIA